MTNSFRLYNTMSRSIEEVEPITPDEIRFYACGPTVYDYTHLGHLRKYTMDDVLVRALKYLGYRVKFVQNITDVGHLTSDSDTGEDKLEKGAKKYNQSVFDIAHKFEDFYWYSMEEMGNLKPDHSTRATEFIQEQIDLVKTLEKKGFTYIIEGDGVYFDTSKFPDYGQLANLKRDELRAGHRVDFVEGKRNVTDFALWKYEKAGENRAMAWESPWAKRGFPGWHIECSAMSMAILGPKLDIHTGGIDHVAIHHTNEIAQSEAASGQKPFVNYWVHHNFLQVENEKMSKSLGNFYTIDDVIKKGFSPQALRMLFLSSHYRSELNFTWENLKGVEKSWKRLLAVISTEASKASAVEKSKMQNKYVDQFMAHIANDLKTPEAMAVFWEAVKTDELSDQERVATLLEMDEVLGLGLGKGRRTKDEGRRMQNAEVEKLISDREEARERKDWQRADEIRNRLEEMGVEIKDRKTG